METYFKPLHFFFNSCILTKAWRKHVLWKLLTTPKVSQLTIKFKVIVMVFRFVFLSSHKQGLFWSIHMTLKDLVDLLPMFGQYLSCFKLLNCNMFCHPIFSLKNQNQCKNIVHSFGYQKIKIWICINIILPKLIRHNLFYLFNPSLITLHAWRFLWKKKTTWGHNCKTKCLN
jgi:hypothetical protein